MDILEPKFAYEIGEGDRVLVNDVDPVIVESKIESGEAIMIKGDSFTTGLPAVYLLDPDAELFQWDI